jgi:hypothetical protein
MKFENHHFIIGKLFHIKKRNQIKTVLFSLMPQRALSNDGKKHVVTVPVRLRKMQGIELSPKHEG